MEESTIRKLLMGMVLPVAVDFVKLDDSLTCNQHQIIKKAGDIADAILLDSKNVEMTNKEFANAQSKSETIEMDCRFSEAPF